MAIQVKLTFLLLTVALTVSISSSAAEGLGRMVGGRTDVKEVEKNREIQELGRFSVEEFNKMQKKHSQEGDMKPLTFSRVVKAQTQVVSGIKYYLKVEAASRGVTKMFDSVVVVKPWLHSKALLNFSPTSSPAY